MFFFSYLSNAPAYLTVSSSGIQHHKILFRVLPRPYGQLQRPAVTVHQETGQNEEACKELAACRFKPLTYTMYPLDGLSLPIPSTSACVHCICNAFANTWPCRCVYMRFEKWTPHMDMLKMLTALENFSVSLSSCTHLW